MESRPVRPPPPNKDLLISQKPSDNVPVTNGYSVYVNIGEYASLDDYVEVECIL